MHSHPARFRLPRTLLPVAVALGAATALAGGNLPAGFQPLTESEYQAAGLSPNEPALKIEYPGSAANRGIGEGTAVVSVAIDAQGKVTDYMLVDCSDKAFGVALLDWVKVMKFQPATYRGVAVPGRCEVGYRFNYHSPSSGEHGFGFSAWGTSSGGLSTGALTMSQIDISGKKLPQKPELAPVAEKQLDQPLEFTDVALPKLPAGFTPSSGRPVKVFVSFYIDAEGKARLPQAESAVAPELVDRALSAVRQWSFKPPVAGGKPALVLTARSVGFVPRTN